MRRAGLIIAILVLIVLFFGINMVANVALTSARLDITDGRVFTLTKGTRNIAASFDEPVTLTLYYSSKLAQGRPPLQQYAKRVQELLAEYARMSKGKIKVETVDPEPDSEAEDTAVALGLAGAPVGPGENFYFGLVGTNSTNTKETIPFFDSTKDRFLEYDLSRFLYSLQNPTKKVVGLITPLSITGGWTMNQQTRQPVQTPAWFVISQIRGLFDLKPLQGPQASIPADIDILMVVHPKGLDDVTLFAIDQFVLKGGHAMFFVDPMCENDEQGQQDPSQRASELSKLFDAWGIEVPANLLATDRELGNQINIGSRQKQEIVSMITIPAFTKDRLNKEDPITASIENINVSTSGFIRAKASTAGSAATITPLIKTSAKAWAMPIEQFGMQPDPKRWLETYQPGTLELPVAARISGDVNSAFPNGIPSTDPAKPATPPGLVKSSTPINVIVVADVDMLSDSLWVQIQNALGQTFANKFAGNGDFVLNALDSLSGSSDLISIRARRGEQRPFTRVQTMQKNAEAALQEREKALNLKLQDTSRKLQELQAKKGADQKYILSAEQEAQVAQFRKDVADTRKELRTVKFSLRKDVETLGTKLKFINIGLIPALVTLTAISLGAFRAARRRSAAARRAA